MLKLENSIRGLSFSRVAFDLTIQGIKKYTLGGGFCCPPKIYYRTIYISVKCLWENKIAKEGQPLLQ